MDGEFTLDSRMADGHTVLWNISHFGRNPAGARAQHVFTDLSRHINASVPKNCS
jgi:hypothetical protein